MLHYILKCNCRNENKCFECLVIWNAMYLIVLAYDIIRRQGMSICKLNIS